MRNDVIEKKLMDIATLLDDLTAAVVTIAGEFGDEKVSLAEEKKEEPVKPEKKEEPAKPEKKEEIVKPEKKYTFEEVRKAMAEKSGAGFTAQVRELLQKHGASKLSEIKESEYAAMMEEVQNIGSAQ